MEGFYSRASLNVIKEPGSLLPKCGLCKLCLTAKTPKMQAQGSGRKGVLIVGEAPGRQEDSQGVQFVGESGMVLKATLKRIGIDLFRDCIVTNSLECFTGNIIKDKKAIEWCRPTLLSTIDYYKPTTIILLGGSATKSLIGHLWKDDVGGIKRWAGFQIPAHSPNAWICPTYHPSFIMRGDKRDGHLYLKVFEEHLRAAFALKDSPWEEVPDYKAQIDVVSADVAAKTIRRMIEKGGRVAWDIETTTLKPDGPDAEIVCCSVCWEGKKTIAYPWMGEAITATKEMLLSPLKKISHNLIFEERWSRAVLGISVKNWYWDTMIQAHVLDCRSRISSLKFQSFIRLGQGDYDGHLKPFLASKDKGGNSPNRIREVDMPSLMLYCGMDSLLTFKIAEIQTATLGVK